MIFYIIQVLVFYYNNKLTRINEILFKIINNLYVESYDVKKKPPYKVQLQTTKEKLFILYYILKITDKLP